MKKIALVLACVSLTAAAATYQELAGTFTSPHEIVLMGYADKASCEADNGKWEDDLGCIFAAEDSVDVSRDLTKVSVETMTTNGHSCSIEADIVAIESDSVVAETPSDEWNSVTGNIEPATCQLTVKYSADKNTVSADSNGKCQSFCGARATPFIGEAKRTR